MYRQTSSLIYDQVRTWLHKKQDVVRDLGREKSGPVLIPDYKRILWLGLKKWQAQSCTKLSD